MERKKKTFKWDAYEASMVFPIDFTSNEAAKPFKQGARDFRNNGAATDFERDARGFRDHVLRHPLFRDILRGLAPIAEDDDPMPPIPLEAVPLLDCFYRLGKQTAQGYHAAVFCRNSIPSNNIDSFWSELCNDLYIRTVPPQNSKDIIDLTFCRHILFQNNCFVSTMLTPIWKQEVLPRYERLLSLAKQATPEDQIYVLTDCLASLDRVLLNLQSRIRTYASSTSSTDSVSVTQQTIQELLESLLSIRRTYKTSKDELVAYNLPNIYLSDGTTLAQAFEDIGSRIGKPPKKQASLLLAARQAYLSHLSKEVESDPAAKDALKLERQYMDLRDYLSVHSLQSEDLTSRIQEECTQYCQQVIAYYTYAPTPGTTPPPNPALRGYNDDLLNYLICGYMNQAVGHFQETLQQAAYYCASQTSVNNYQIYEQMVLMHLKYRIKEGAKSAEDSSFLLSELENIPILPIPTAANVFYHDAIGLCPYIQKAWEFIYSGRTPLFDAETHCFQNPDAIAVALWKDGTTAAQFFSKEELSFSSELDARAVIDSYDRIVSNGDRIFPPVLFWNSVPRILQVLLLQVLQKIVEKTVPELVKYFQPHLTH